MERPRVTKWLRTRSNFCWAGLPFHDLFLEFSPGRGASKNLRHIQQYGVWDLITEKYPSILLRSLQKHTIDMCRALRVCDTLVHPLTRPKVANYLKVNGDSQ